MEVIAWLIALVAFLVIEGITVTLVCIWFAGGALIGLLAAALHAPIWLQVLLFLLVCSEGLGQLKIIFLYWFL